MRKQINIEVPNDWAAIPLRKYLELSEALKSYEGEEQAQTAAVFYHICGITPEIMLKLDTDIFIQIRDHLEKFMKEIELPLVKKFTHNGVEYGFEPNLSKIAYGAYVDLSNLKMNELNKDWAKAMAILYRPIRKQSGKLYELVPYTGEEEWEWFLDMGMDLHFGAWFFFINLLMDLSSAIPSYTMEMVEEQLPNIKSTLEKNGVTIPPL